MSALGVGMGLSAALGAVPLLQPVDAAGVPLDLLGVAHDVLYARTVAWGWCWRAWGTSWWLRRFACWPRGCPESRCRRLPRVGVLRRTNPHGRCGMPRAGA